MDWQRSRGTDFELGLIVDLTAELKRISILVRA